MSRFRDFVMKILRNRKGASVLIEQMFILLFGIILLVMVFTVFNTLYSKTTDSISQSQYEEVANYIQNRIVLAGKAMEISNYGKIFLDVPSRIGGQPYRIIIENETNYVNVTNIARTTSAYVRIFNINASINGSAYPGGSGRIFLFYTSNSTQKSIVLAAEERIIR